MLKSAINFPSDDTRMCKECAIICKIATSSSRHCIGAKEYSPMGQIARFLKVTGDVTVIRVPSHPKLGEAALLNALGGEFQELRLTPELVMLSVSDGHQQALPHNSSATYMARRLGAIRHVDFIAGPAIVLTKVAHAQSAT